MEKEIKFTNVCEAATFARRVSIGMSYKTILDVDNGFGDRTSACREYTAPREDPNLRIYATIPGQTTIGPVLQFAYHMVSMTSAELKFRFLPQQRKIGNLGGDMPRVKTATWRSYISTIQTTIPRSLNCWGRRIGEISCKRKRTSFDKVGAFMEHRGN